jgi:hypothetical protein
MTTVETIARSASTRTTARDETATQSVSYAIATTAPSAIMTAGTATNRAAGSVHLAAERPFATAAPVPTGGAADPRRVVTGLQADRLEAELRRLDMHRQFLDIVDGLRVGFDFNLRSFLSSTVVHRNHASTSLAPEFIDSYIEGEVRAGRYSGP